MATLLARLYDFQAHTIIYADQVDAEFNQIVNLLSGISSDRRVYLNVVDSTNPPLRLNQGGTGPVAEFKVAGTTKVAVDNVGRVVSSVPAGTAPFMVASATCVTNLNSDMVDGIHASAFAQLAAATNTFSGSVNVGGGLNVTGALDALSVDADAYYLIGVPVIRLNSGVLEILAPAGAEIKLLSGTTELVRASASVFQYEGATIWHDSNVSAGSGITISSRTISHADTSSVANSSNTGGTVIQSLTFDTYGHVLTRGTVNLDSRYLLLSGGTISGATTINGALTVTANPIKVDTNVVWHDGNVTAGGGITISSRTISHTDTSSQASVNNSNGVVIQDVTLDTYGHVTALGSVNLDSRYSLTSHTHPEYSVTVHTHALTDLTGVEITTPAANQVLRYDGTKWVNSGLAAGTGILVSGLTISHADTSSQASVNNSNGVVIQDVTLDTYGHVTALGSVNLDSRYAASSHSHALSDLSDVTLSSLSSGQVLEYDGSKWVNVTMDQFNGEFKHISFSISNVEQWDLVTVVNITGSGRIVNLTGSVQTTPRRQFYEMRITVDGGTAVIVPLRDFYKSIAISSTSFDKATDLPLGHGKFSSSLKIEVSHSQTTKSTIVGTFIYLSED